MRPAVITLHTAQPADAGTLGAMITDAAAAHAWKPRPHSAAQDIAHAGMMIDHGWVTLAESDGAICGFLAVEESYIHGLFVAPHAQRHGFGSALLRDAQRGRDRLELWTFQRNTDAQRFYLRHGFVEIARTAGDNDEGLPDIRYQWRRADAAARGYRP